jgi:hypothetical protein
MCFDEGLLIYITMKRRPFQPADRFYSAMEKKAEEREREKATEMS